MGADPLARLSAKEKENFSLAFHVRVMHNKRKMRGAGGRENQEEEAQGLLHICVGKGKEEGS